MAGKKTTPSSSHHGVEQPSPYDSLTRPEDSQTVSLCESSPSQDGEGMETFL